MGRILIILWISLCFVCFAQGLFKISHADEYADAELRATLDGIKSLSPGNQRMLLDSMGVPDTGGGLNIWNIVGGILFGMIGMSSFIYGKKMASVKPMVIGIVLMAFPYFVSNTLLLYLIGASLTGGLFFFRE